MDTVFRLRVGTEDLERWRVAAGAVGVSAWLRGLANDASYGFPVEDLEPEGEVSPVVEVRRVPARSISQVDMPGIIKECSHPTHGRPWRKCEGCGVYG
jgi:hypothetical protein